MQSFSGRIAIVTGGGTGMGRELVRQLADEGCHVAMCDVFDAAMAETKKLCEDAGARVRITTHRADVSSKTDIERFRDAVAKDHATDKIHLLINNAGIGGGNSLFTNSREEWEKTFNVCWGGVYECTRAFLPMLVKADEGHLVNTSSVNGFWASLGPQISHTAYSAAKFAVKGFTEALITDLRLHAPHVKCSVVMPGHIGTEIMRNSRKILSGNFSDEITPAQIAAARTRIAAMGIDTANMSDDAIVKMIEERTRRFIEEAPMTAAQAAKIILDGVKAGRWRILVGEDAVRLDDMIRREPERAYDEDFFGALIPAARR